MNIFITIWNRFTWAIPLCEDFAKAGLNVIIIDNKSTYEPCVEWLSKCPYKVIHMKENNTAWAFFTTDLYQQYTDRYFMISDSDQSITGIPSDWVNVLMKGLELHTENDVWKCGLSQRIDDIPQDNPYGLEIYNYEKAFCSTLTPHGYYKADMDLGIAVYDRSRRSENPIAEHGRWYNAVRSREPYQSRHLDWYLTPASFREEDKYSLESPDRKQGSWLLNWKEKYGYKTPTQ